MDKQPLLQTFTQPRTWLSLALLVFAAIDLQRGAPAAAGIDFYQFWLVAQQHDRPDVYDPAVRRAVGQAALQRARQRGGREEAAAEFNAQVYPDVIEPTATPLLYVATRLTVTGDYERDLARFQLASNLAALAALVVLCRLCGFTRVDSMLAAAVAALCLSPIRHDLTHANTARLQLFMLTAPLLVLSRWPRSGGAAAVAGALLGLAIMYKPNIAAAAPLLLLPRLARREMTRAAALALGIAGGMTLGFAAGAAGFAGAGAGAWASWWRALRALDYPLAMGNCGGGRVIAELTGMNLGGVAFLLALACSAAFTWVGVKRSQASTSADDVAAVAAGCLVMLIASPLAWVHYYVLAIPMGLYLLRPPREPAAPAAADAVRQGLACLALAAIARVPLQAAIGATSQRQLAAGYVLAAAALLAIAAWDRLSSRPHPT
jgi:hypothetical protein